MSHPFHNNKKFCENSYCHVTYKFPCKHLFRQPFTYKNIENLVIMFRFYIHHRQCALKGTHVPWNIFENSFHFYPIHLYSSIFCRIESFKRGNDMPCRWYVTNNNLTTVFNTQQIYEENFCGQLLRMKMFGLRSRRWRGFVFFKIIFFSVR